MKVDAKCEFELDTGYFDAAVVLSILPSCLFFSDLAIDPERPLREDLVL